MDEQSRVAVEYLRQLPPDAVVHWSSHHVSASQPWTSRWIDVRIEDEGAPDYNWIWTIIGEDDADGTGPEQLWQFVWPYDLDVHEVWGQEHRVIREWVTPRGTPDLGEPPGAGERHLLLGGWSVKAVAFALQDWATRHADRPDLRFEWEPDGKPDLAVLRAAERAREIEEGGQVWDLGDGLVIADGFMDELLAMDPDERDEVMKALREARGRVVGTGENGRAGSD
jgi:hypothetical protein